MILLFLHGPPAVGKLTVAKELAELTGFKLFHNHLTVDLVCSVFPFGSESFIKLREEIWLGVFREAADRDVSLIFTFAPETTVRPQFIQNAIDVVESAGGKVVFVELACNEAELEERMVDPSRRTFGKLSSTEEYRALKERGVFQFPALPAELSIDTTHSSAEATAQKIVDYLTKRK
jgi:hypothetical protein